MFAKKFIFTLTLTLLLASFAAAQSTDRASQWRKYFGRNARIQSVAPISAEDGTAADLKQEEPASPQPGAVVKGRLEGTWLATVTFSDGFALKVLFTFMPGKDETEGTLIDTNEFLLTPNPIGAPDQGVWQRLSDRSFIATHLAFLFDAEDGGAPAGTAKVRDSITLNDPGTQFTGRQYVEIFDPNGQLEITFQATMTAVRLKATAPPAF